MIQARDQEKAWGKLVVLSGPSGVGKSTICREVVKRMKNAYLSVSVTTRARAAAEENGREYWFVSRDEFHRCIEKDALLEYAEVFGNLYGTPKDKTDEALARRQDRDPGNRCPRRQAGQGPLSGRR